MDDLQLLELLEKAQKKQRGPQGATGVGIDSVEQFDQKSFTLRLTDGSFKKIDLPIPSDGETGPEGVKGEKGDVGAEGKPGKPGKDALPGAPGRDGAPGTSLNTAVVNSSGELLLGLSDGSLINVGRVVGPAGATGAAGPTGLPGAAGVDGEAVLSGPRAPQSDDGKEGDHWIDISSAEFGFYKKGGDGWSKLANLRQPAKDTRVGAGAGGGSGSGGNGELQNTRTLPLINGGDTIRKTAKNKGLPVPGVLITQEDANQYFLGCLREQDVSISEAVPRPPHQAGQLWFCTNPSDLTLYVYDGAVWVPAAPPVSLDGIEASIANVDAELLKVNANIAMNKRDIDEAVLDVREDQERQDAELKELHEKIDGIAEEFDRGKWAHVTEKPTIGQYALGVKVTAEYCQDQYLKCVEDADNDPEKLSACTRQMGECENAEDAGDSVYVSRWGQVDHISIHTEESDGQTHGFGDYTVDKYIEIVNEGDEGNATYIITEDAKIVDGVAIVAVSDIQSTGVPSGLGRFKVFEMKAGDPTGYVRKAGDRMTGRLQIQPDKDTETGLVVFAGKNLPAESKTVVFAVTDTKGNSIFEVKNHGRIKAGTVEYTPQYDTDIVTKKYADQLRGPATLTWRWLGEEGNVTTAPEDGGFYKMNAGGGPDYIRLSFKSDNNIDLGSNRFSDSGFRSTQYGPFATIWTYNENNSWQLIKQLRIDGYRWNYNDHHEYQISSSYGKKFSDFVVGQAYYITIGGFF